MKIFITIVLTYTFILVHLWGNENSVTSTKTEPSHQPVSSKGKSVESASESNTKNADIQVVPLTTKNISLSKDRYQPTRIATVSAGKGKFYSGDKELRIWGFNSAGINMEDEQYEQSANRLASIGVNLVRLHSISQQHYHIRQEGKEQPMGLLPLRSKPSSREIVNEDKFFKLLNRLREKNIYVAITLAHGRLLKPGDSDILQTNEQDKKAWEDAIREISVKFRGPQHIYRYLFQIDERALALKKEFASEVLNLKNPETGIQIKDDPQIAFIETVNEMFSFYIIRGKGKLVTMLPDYFKDKLVEKWNEFLIDKYRSHEDLSKAWSENNRIALNDGENLSIKSIMIHPLIDEDNLYSSQRRKDLQEFCVWLDLNSQKKMKEHYRKVGYKGLTIYSGFWTNIENTDELWFKGGTFSYGEDHYYGKSHDLFRSKDLICAKNKANFPADLPYWRSEARNSTGSVNVLHWSRVAHPLYYAVYNSLIGRDGTAFHSWLFHPRHDYSFNKWSMEKAPTHYIHLDIPWQIVFRAAGRLFKSGEIKPIPLGDPRLQTIAENADIITTQVYRKAKEGVLKAETENFAALAVDHPYECKFEMADVKIYSDKCNILIIEKLSEKEYEVTAMGMAGQTVDRTIRKYNDFEPMTYVRGSVDFNGRKIQNIYLFDEMGNPMGEIKRDDKKLHLIDGYYLYKVVLE